MSLFTLPAALLAFVFAADAAPEPGSKTTIAHVGKAMGLCAKLECTAEQQEKVSEIRAELRHELEANKTEMQSLRHAYAAEFRKDELNEAMLDALKERMDATSDRRAESLQDALADLHRVLQPSQRAKVADRLERHGPAGVLHGHGHHGKGKGKGKDDDARRRANHDRAMKGERTKKAERLEKSKKAKRRAK